MFGRLTVEARRGAVAGFVLVVACSVTAFATKSVGFSIGLAIAMLLAVLATVALLQYVTRPTRADT